MRRTLICPKCDGRRILHVTQLADRVGEIGGGRVEHGLDPEPSPGQFYPLRIARLRNPDGSFFKSHVSAAGLVEAFVCRACGFTELYTCDPEQIPVDGELVYELSGPPTEGAYR